MYIYISFFLSFLSVSHPFFSVLTCISVFIADNVFSSHFRLTLLCCSDTVSLFPMFGFSNKQCSDGREKVAAWTHLFLGRIRF